MRNPSRPISAIVAKMQSICRVAARSGAVARLAKIILVGIGVFLPGQSDAGHESATERATPREE